MAETFRLRIYNKLPRWDVSFAHFRKFRIEIGFLWLGYTQKNNMAHLKITGEGWRCFKQIYRKVRQKPEILYGKKKDWPAQPCFFQWHQFFPYFSPWPVTRLFRLVGEPHCPVGQEMLQWIKIYFDRNFQGALHMRYVDVYRIHPKKLTWNLEMMVSNRNLLFQGPIFRFHVCFGGCT